MQNQYASTTLTINLGAIRDNYRILQKKAHGAKVAAVVKANAYGLGVEQVASTLASIGCDSFFVANLDEAIELRGFLPDADIFVFHGFEHGQEEVFYEFGITPVLNTISQMELWINYADNIGLSSECIIHFDTGMNRLGIKLSEIQNSSLSLWKGDRINQALSPTAGGIPGIKYIISHLACADDQENAMNAEQLAEFKNITDSFKNVPRCIANSGGIFLGKEYHFDMVRPGIALYGGNPTNYLPNPIKNVVQLTSHMLQIQRIDRDGTVGYGASQAVLKGTKIATIAAGYADGYLRSLSNNGICAVDGIIVPIIGRVSMDLVTIDVSKIPDEKLKPGAEVELIGDNIPVDVAAKHASTISYEILTSLGKRYKRVYLD